MIWDAFIADIQTKDSGKKKSKKRAARDFKAEVMKKMKVRQLIIKFKAFQCSHLFCLKITNTNQSQISEKIIYHLYNFLHHTWDKKDGNYGKESVDDFLKPLSGGNGQGSPKS